MPEWIETIGTTSFWGNSVLRWAGAALTLVVAFVALRLVKRVLSRRLTRHAEKSSNRIDDLAADLLARTRWFFLLAVSASLAAMVLALPAEAEPIPGHVLVLATFVQAGIWAAGLIRFWVGNLGRADDDEGRSQAALATVLGVAGQIAVWAVVGLLVLQNLGIEVTALIAGLGVGGIAVALAVQNILGDLLASLSIALDKPFVPGDFIVVGTLMGTVEQIGLKTTRIRSIGGELLVFANSDLLASRIQNFKKMSERRVLFSLGVTYQTPLARLEELPRTIREIVEATPGTRFARAHFKGYGDSALVFEVVYYVATPDYDEYMDAQQRINLELFRRFAELEVEFAYPTQTIHVASTPPAPAAPAAPAAQERARSGERSPGPGSGLPTAPLPADAARR